MLNLDFDIQILLSVLLLTSVAVFNTVVAIYRLRVARLRQNNQPTVSQPRRWWTPIWNWKIALVSLLVVVIALIIPIGAYMHTPHIQSSYPTQEGYWQEPDRPIEIIFNVPVEIDSLQAKFSRTEIKGDFVPEKYLGFLPVTRKITYVPPITMPPEERVVVYVTGMDRLGVVEYHEGALNFFTHKLAEVFSTSPVNDETDVLTSTEITITLDGGNTTLADWEVKITPEIAFDFDQSNPEVFKIKPQQKLNQGETYTVTLNRTPVVIQKDIDERTAIDNPTAVAELSFTTVKSPLVEKFEPSGRSLTPTEPLLITFEQEMDRTSVEEALSFSPDFEYMLNWQSDKLLEITPNTGYAKDANYTMTIAAGAKTKMGGVLENDSQFTFATIGVVRVLSFNPTSGAVRIPRSTQVRMTFDHQVDQASAQAAFTSNMGGGNFGWEGNTMVFTPAAPLGFDTTYTITINPGVNSAQGGDTSKEAFSAAFVTVPNQTVINGFGPGSWDHQDYTFSCGVAALKMALAWKGVFVDEATIIYSLMGNNNSYKTWNAALNRWEWGDPNVNYLGDPNGSGDVNNQNAYGVHWQPVMNVLSYYGIGNRLERGWNVYGLAQEINAGRPVQIFWWNGVSSYYGAAGGQPLVWFDPSTGQQVEAINGMHSILIVGFNGDVENPTSFVALDPWFGYITYSIDTFNYQWPKLNNTGVVIY